MHPAPLAQARSRHRVLGALALCLITASSTALADRVYMPAGGTSWIELEGKSGDGLPEFGAANVMPLAEYKGTFSNPILAGGTVSPTGIHLLQTAPSGTAGFTFQWGATGGIFTLHGSGSDPVSLRATMDATGTLSRSHPTSFTFFALRIGSWNDQPTSSDLNFRVNAFVVDNFGCTFNACAAGVTPASKSIFYDFSATPGQSFNLGYKMDLNLQSGPAGSTTSGDITAALGFVIPQGYYITGTNGFDSRIAAAVPEPDTWAMLLAGIGLMGWVARRRVLPAQHH